MARTLLCLGHGHVASALARRLAPEGWTIIGTRRTAAQDATARIVVFDGETAATSLIDLVAAADAVLVSIPPDEEGDLPFRVMGDALRRRTGWTGYLSTTGVYGDRGGGWAFEDDPCAPTSPPPARRVRAERQYLSLPTPAHIFRLPGIYGPGRSALDRVRSGAARRIVKAGLVLSRAHEDDIAAALARSVAQANPGRIYNVCDDAPAPPQDVTAYAAQLLGVAPPPEISFADANLPPASVRFYMDSKRVSNARLKAELGWRPMYPGYREGLRAILDAES